jgi:hypothetical protein
MTTLLLHKFSGCFQASLDSLAMRFPNAPTDTEHFGSIQRFPEPGTFALAMAMNTLTNTHAALA